MPQVRQQESSFVVSYFAHGVQKMISKTQKLHKSILWLATCDGLLLHQSAQPSWKDTEASCHHSIPCQEVPQINGLQASAPKSLQCRNRWAGKGRVLEEGVNLEKAFHLFVARGVGPAPEGLQSGNWLKGRACQHSSLGAAQIGICGY